MKRLYHVIVFLSLASGLLNGMDQKRSGENKEQKESKESSDNFSQINFEELLPAIINTDWYKKTNFSTSIRGLAYRCAEVSKTIPYDDAHDKPFIRIISRQINNSDVSDYSNPNYEKIINPRELMKHELVSGEFAVVGWSNGTTSIIVSKVDKKRMEEFTSEQQAFIAGLYKQMNTTAWTITSHDARIFFTLESGIQQNLKNFYGDEFTKAIKDATLSGQLSNILNKPLVKIAFAAALLTGVYYGGKWFVNKTDMGQDSWKYGSKAVSSTWSLVTFPFRAIGNGFVWLGNKLSSLGA